MWIEINNRVDCPDLGPSGLLLLINAAGAVSLGGTQVRTTRAKIGAINAIVDLDSHGPSGLPGTV